MLGKPFNLSEPQLRLCVHMHVESLQLENSFCHPFPESLLCLQMGHLYLLSYSVSLWDLVQAK